MNPAVRKWITLLGVALLGIAVSTGCAVKRPAGTTVPPPAPSSTEGGKAPAAPSTISTPTPAPQPAAAPAPTPAAAGARPAPRLEIDKEVVDLGDVVRGTKADATFLLRNAGVDTLKILSAKPG